MVGHEDEAKAMVSAGQVLLPGKVDIHTQKNILFSDTTAFADEKIRNQLSPTHGEGKDEITETQP
ncbi:MAG: hypothetical protein ABI618_16130 [Nitrospirota bacterium]